MIECESTFVFKIITPTCNRYKPRNAEKSVRIAFPANTSVQIENAYNNIADLTPSELRERGGALFHFDYLGEDAIALLSTAVPPGIGLETIQFYRHCWGMRQQDGRDLIRLTGRDAVTASNAVLKSRRTLVFDDTLYTARKLNSRSITPVSYTHLTLPTTPYV